MNQILHIHVQGVIKSDVVLANSSIVNPTSLAVVVLGCQKCGSSTYIFLFPSLLITPICRKINYCQLSKATGNN
ncbi:MAG: hypothetical protein V3U87_11265 [Methylococcaceae bacterium]